MALIDDASQEQIKKEIKYLQGEIKENRHHRKELLEDIRRNRIRIWKLKEDLKELKQK